jgi:hypothetical protein
MNKQMVARTSKQYVDEAINIDYRRAGSRAPVWSSASTTGDRAIAGSLVFGVAEAWRLANREKVMLRLLWCGSAAVGLVISAADCLAMGGGGNLSLERSPYAVLLQAPTDARSDTIKPARGPGQALRRSPAAHRRPQ